MVLRVVGRLLFAADVAGPLPVGPLSPGLVPTRIDVAGPTAVFGLRTPVTPETPVEPGVARGRLSPFALTAGPAGMVKGPLARFG